MEWKASVLQKLTLFLRALRVKVCHGSSFHLPQFPNGIRLSPDQRNILWDSKVGFTIRSPTFYYTGPFMCETPAADQQSRIYIVHRPGQCMHRCVKSAPHLSLSACVYHVIFDCVAVTVSNILDVYLNSSGSLQALKGERLALNCTATGELNTRVNITWDFPGQVCPRSVRQKSHMM